MSLVPVDEAVSRLLTGVEPGDVEHMLLAACLGRALAGDIAARLTQPPFPASAMDGYAVRASEATKGTRLTVAGASRAGERFAGTMEAGACVRIFTGAPVPDEADAVLIQENAETHGEQITVKGRVKPGAFIRPAGLDFRDGEVLLQESQVLDARALALSAAMGHGMLPVRRRPRVAVLANGDELVPPGATPGPDQIVSSNGVGLTAFASACGAEPIDLGIAPDDRDAIGAFVDKAAGADILVVVGGASVGEHDLVQSALTDRGMALDFWRIAMRPGKPLMVGRLGTMRVLGLPGNPVSALVCSRVFLKPLINAMLGLTTTADVASAKLGAPMPANDNRQDYVRARLKTVDGERVAVPFGIQDSSMLATLAAADALIIRPIGAPAVAAGDSVPILLL